MKEDDFSYPISSWPYEGFEYMSDLIDFEGPILVHYQLEKEGRHALFYWVEGTKEYNRWLCFEVTLSDLYEFMNKNISFYSLVQLKSLQAFFIVDIDSEVKYKNHRVIISGYLIPKTYLPDEESYFLSTISPQYKELFSKAEKSKSDYINELSEDSFELRLDAIEPRGKTGFTHYDKLISLKEAKNLFSRFFDSSTKYTGITFEKEYGKDFAGDDEALEDITSIILKATDYKIIRAGEGSFFVTLSIDKVLKREYLKPEYVNFTKTVAERFKNEILSLDLNNEDHIATIENKFTDSERKEIFKPLIKLINSNECTLTFIDKKKNVVHKYKKIDYQNKRRILPSKPKGELSEPLKKVFTTYTVEHFENIDPAKANYRDIIKGTKHRATQSDCQLPYIAADRFVITFFEPLRYLLKPKNEQGLYEAVFEPLNFQSVSADRDETQALLIEQIIKAIVENYIAKTPKNKEIKEYFDDVIDDVTEVTPPDELSI